MYVGQKYRVPGSGEDETVVFSFSLNPFERKKELSIKRFPERKAPRLGTGSDWVKG